MRSSPGFVLLDVDLRRRGRPDRRRRVTVSFADGTRLSFSSANSPAVVRAVVESVLRVRRRAC